MEEFIRWGREKESLAIPWGLHFNVLQCESGRMK